MTNECDVLREEIAMLAAENRRLLNENRRLLNENQESVYPEAAVRAVWEHGYRVGKRPYRRSYYWKDHAEEVSRIFVEALQMGDGQ